MNKKKAIKILSATAVAATAFVATSPAQAASTNDAASLVKKAKDAGTVLKWAISTEGSADGTTRPWAQYNAAKVARDAAVAAVNKLPAAQKAAYLADIEQNVTLHINRAMAYIDAITAGEKIKAKKEALEVLIAKNLIDDQTETAYHELSKEIRKQAILLDRVYGKSTRDEIRKAYKETAETVRDSIKYEVTVKIELDLAKKALADNNVAVAEKHLAEAAKYMTEVKNVTMKEELVKTLAEIEAQMTPKVASVSAINGTQVKVTFNKDVKSAVPANFTVTRQDDANIRQFVSKVEVNSANKKEVTLTFADKLTADKSYKLVANNVVVEGDAKVENSTSEFTYEKSVVTGVEFTATTLAPTKNVKDIVKVTDQLGRDITKEVEFEVETSDSAVITTDGLAGAEGSAIVRVKVKGTNVTTAATTIKVSNKVATSFVGLHIGADLTAKTTKEFKEMKKEDVVTSINMGAQDQFLNMFYSDQYGNDDLDAKVGAEVTYTNITPEVAVVDVNGKITPISTGTAVVKVKVGEVETTVNFEVKATAKIATIHTDKETVKTAIDAIQDTFKVSFKDQYGQAIKFDASKLTIKSADETIAKATASATTGNKDEVIYSVKGIKEGTTNLTVTYTDGDLKLEKVMPVTVTKAGTLKGYVVETDYTILDTNFAATETEKDNNAATVKVYSVDENGNKLAAVKATDTTFVFVDEANTNAVKDKITLDQTADTVTLTSNPAKDTNAQVQVKVGNLVVDTITFEIKNTESTATSVAFDNTALPSLTVGANLDENLKELVTVKDQFGKIVAAPSLTFEYVVTNATNGFQVGESKEISIADATKDATADVVITKVSVAGNNLLTTPVVVKSVVKAPITVGHATDAGLSKSVTTFSLKQDLTTVVIAAGSDKKITFTKSLETWTPNGAYTDKTEELKTSGTEEEKALIQAGYKIYKDSNDKKLVMKSAANEIKFAWTNGTTVSDLNENFAKTFSLSVTKAK